MRDKNFSSIQFIQQLNKQLSEVPTMCESLRMRVVMDPNFLDSDASFVFPRKLSEFEALCFLSWYVPEELRVLIQLDLEVQLQRYSLEDRTVCEILLLSKAEALCWLIETNRFHTRDFFGNFLRQGLQALKSLKVKRKSTKVVKGNRKRGYDDHGTLRPSHKWKPTSDWSLTEEQNEIERKRLSFKDTINFLRGLFS